MNAKRYFGVIGGSGVYQLPNLKIIKEHVVETPFGKPSAPILEAELSGIKCFFLPRHGKNHEFLPHEVNYRANIFAMKLLGVEFILSVSAVGSLSEDCPPGTFVLPDQFIDWTKGQRSRSFFGKGIIAHVSTAYPIDINLQKMIFDSCQKLKISCEKGGTYICIEGPQFSSRAESIFYKEQLGAKVIGMTNVPESYLAKEAGIAYATMAMVTDFDCWKDEHCNIGDILGVMKNNTKIAQKVILDLLPNFREPPFSFTKENRIGLMTPKDSLPKEQQSILETLMS